MWRAYVALWTVHKLLGLQAMLLTIAAALLSLYGKACAGDVLTPFDPCSSVAAMTLILISLMTTNNRLGSDCMLILQNLELVTMDWLRDGR